MINVGVNIDTTNVIKRLRIISNQVNDKLAKGINDAAFGLRSEWLKGIDQKIDHPSKFTRRVFVKKAAPDNLVGEVYLPPTQAEYLSPMITGGDRKPGGVASLRDDLLIPYNGPILDMAGNFTGGPRKWLATIEQKNEDIFVGSPSAKTPRKAVYERLSTGRLRLVAFFSKQVEYKKTLDLEGMTEDYQPTVDSIFSKILKEI